MTVHIVKLCVGADSIDDLRLWQEQRLADDRRAKRTPRLVHTTFQSPKRQDDVLDGGSLYWVIKGLIQVRQRITGFDTGQKADGSPCCLLVLDPTLVPVRPLPRRPFQGWRYLSATDVPADLKSDGSDEIAEMPAHVRKELAALGLL
jgi:hypothetical protein